MVNVASTLSNQSAVWKAAICGHHSIIESLLELGASVDIQDIHGGTSLSVACQEGHLACVNSLLQAGASLTLSNKWG